MKYIYSKDMTEDQLQNALILISHHLHDMEVGLKEKDLDYVKRGLHDIKEIVSDMEKYLDPQSLAEEVQRAKE